jgi:hypothetical protein
MICTSASTRAPLVDDGRAVPQHVPRRHHQQLALSGAAIAVRQLHASQSDLQWIVDAYALVFGSLLLVCGSLSDRFGAKARCRSVW